MSDSQGLFLFDDIAPTVGALRESCPYRGLRSFGPADGAVFWGRRKAIGELRDRIADHQILFVQGGSGSGKSSLVKAGLLPSLSGVGGVPKRPGRWYVAESRPDKTPLANIRAALTLLLKRWDAKPEEQEAALRAVESGRIRLDSLAAFVAGALPDLDRRAQGRPPGPPNFLIIIDQFEEIFRPAVPSDEREAVISFIRDLHAASESAREASGAPGVFLIVTMRSENLHDCGEYEGLADVVNRTQYLLGRMTSGELCEAIEEPARQVFTRFGLSPDLPTPGRFEEGLTRELLKASQDLGFQLEEHKADYLPLLQHALTRIWIRTFQGPPEIEVRDPVLTWKVLGVPQAKTGKGLADVLKRGAQEALENSVDALTGKVSNPKQALRTVFTGFAERTQGGVYTRRLLSLDEAKTLAGLESEDIKGALRVFVDGGYLNERDNGSYDIAHEALVRRWPWLQVAVDSASGARHALIVAAKAIRENFDVQAPAPARILNPMTWQKAGRCIYPQLASQLEPVYGGRADMGNLQLGARWAAIVLGDREPDPSLANWIRVLRDAATTWHAIERLGLRLSGLAFIAIVGLVLSLAKVYWTNKELTVKSAELTDALSQLTIKSAELGKANKALQDKQNLVAALSVGVLSAGRLQPLDKFDTNVRVAAHDLRAAMQLAITVESSQELSEQEQVLWAGLFGVARRLLGMPLLLGDYNMHHVVPASYQRSEGHAACMHVDDDIGEAPSGDKRVRTVERYVQAGPHPSAGLFLMTEGKAKYITIGAHGKPIGEFRLSGKVSSCLSQDGSLLIFRDRSNLTAVPVQWICQSAGEASCAEWRPVLSASIRALAPARDPMAVSFAKAVESGEPSVISTTYERHRLIHWPDSKQGEFHVGLLLGHAIPERVSGADLILSPCPSDLPMQRNVVHCSVGKVGRHNLVAQVIATEPSSDSTAHGKAAKAVITIDMLRSDHNGSSQSDDPTTALHFFEHFGAPITRVAFQDNDVLWEDETGLQWRAIVGTEPIMGPLKELGQPPATSRNWYTSRVCRALDCEPWLNPSVAAEQ